MLKCKFRFNLFLWQSSVRYLTKMDPVTIPWVVCREYPGRSLLNGALVYELIAYMSTLNVIITYSRAAYRQQQNTTMPTTHIQNAMNDATGILDNCVRVNDQHSDKTKILITILVYLIYISYMWKIALHQGPTTTVICKNVNTHIFNWQLATIFFIVLVPPTGKMSIILYPLMYSSTTA